MVGKPNRTKEEKARIVMEALSDTTSIAEICRKNDPGKQEILGEIPKKARELVQELKINLDILRKN